MSHGGHAACQIASALFSPALRDAVALIRRWPTAKNHRQGFEFAPERIQRQAERFESQHSESLAVARLAEDYVRTSNFRPILEQAYALAAPNQAPVGESEFFCGQRPDSSRRKTRAGTTE
jgi:hypothetical protein